MNIRDELGKRIIFFDGGMGTMLQERGLQVGELPELWNLSHPDEMVSIHSSYLDAGADIILSNTFGANSIKFGENTAEIIKAGVKNAKTAVKNSNKEAYVALDIGPTGKLLKPMGTLDFEEAVGIFAEIIKVGESAGADIILIETMSDTYELKAAVLAAKENSNLPVMATAVFDENKKMLTGSSPQGMVALLEGLGVDALGMNCGLGPKQMKSICKEIARCASIPIIINPNAGLPRTENGRTVFDFDAEEFAEDMKDIVNSGAWLVGGCCGTTPEHIRRLVETCSAITPKPIEEKNNTIVSSYSQVVELGDRPVIIGERINPTGKSKFKQALRDHDMQYILSEAVKQSDAGAHILDVNVGLPEIDEVELMKETVSELQEVLPLPLQIDTTDAYAMEQALRIYNGKAMINSVNGKKEVMESIFPLVKKYGGVVIGLTIDEDGIPDTSGGRVAIAKKIYEVGASYGISKKDIVIDPLTMTLSTNQLSAQITLDAVKQIKAMGGRTVLGVSNISFGLPQRKLINTTFFTMALQSGLSAGIINPETKEMMQAYDTFLTLSGYDEQCSEYINKYAIVENSPVVKKDETGNLTLKDCIIKGLKEQSFNETQKALENRDPMEIINGELVPALDIVGDGYEKGTMFLPQLLMSAEAAKSGFEAIKQHMLRSGTKQESKGRIVIATVKGDIHDIGKNIVKVLLENYGYEVLDLGKDVPPEDIVDAVMTSKAPIVGLSALMTTTVVYMKETIELLRKSAPWCKVMVGGAVLTQDYADKIGADFYGRDAMQSVYYVEKLLNSN